MEEINKLNDSDTSNEYQFNDEQYGDNQHDRLKHLSGTLSSIATFGHGKSKRFLIPIGLVLSIYIIYQLLGWFSSKKETEMAQVVPSEQTASSEPVKQAPPPASTVNLPQPTAPTANDDIYQQLSSISKQEEDNRNQFAKINNELGNQQAGLNNLNNSVAALNTSVEMLKKSIDNMVAKANKAKIKKVKKIAPPKIVYHIKAMVPGRAWLEDYMGKTITVRVGDTINGGTIEMISPGQGMIATSSGEIIQYGSNDI
jgi:intracellular multiplication protein IcmG